MLAKRSAASCHCSKRGSQTLACRIFAAKGSFEIAGTFMDSAPLRIAAFLQLRNAQRPAQTC
ncbi:hypothetical protein DFH08DRAFT_974860 [Mycena albidolilacea]|uniref:Uncharacterized protein n=1 Tax=Mycena albidolilacea TaxID=1033008 RepID=A0AAD7EBB9_9AGAR|nr:hypothetical protein DFH08DRAFT_974860 [Mycena albidolilacea]